ncbi:MAG: twin-arginine translocase subunit TatC, partial [Deltaproteobacteria bacterium]|nr:twin-arginine translocase subunit TatC [Deltaproteobacteria bacterium]
MDVTVHLRELRSRLIVCVLASCAGFAVAYYFSEGLYKLLARPLLHALPPGKDFMVFTGIVEPFFIYFKVGMLGGIVIASPVILYEIWGFVAPALYREEKFWLLFIVLSSFILFVSGTLFAYFIVFPFGFKYLLSFEG